MASNKIPVNNASRKEVMQRLSKALANCETISIRLNGDDGKLTIKVGIEIIARYSDVQHAISILLPEQMDLVA